jgi:predicted glutamine amidotransferase
VRAATGTDASRANCHPFASGTRLFMHNGQIGGYGRIRRRVEAMIDDRLYDGVLVVSEPCDDARGAWEPVDPDTALRIGPDLSVRATRFGAPVRAAPARTLAAPSPSPSH